MTKLRAGIFLAVVGLVIYGLGVLTPFDTNPQLSPSGQRRGTYFFFGVLLTLGGLFLFVWGIFSTPKK